MGEIMFAFLTSAMTIALILVTVALLCINLQDFIDGWGDEEDDDD